MQHVEHSRKHGPFDCRWPSIRHTPAPASLWRLGEERLDWQAFLARFFPGSHRHDFDALAAYESYSNDAECPAGGSTAPTLDAPSNGRVAEEPPATDDTERWESDGGASTARPRQTTSSRAT